MVRTVFAWSACLVLLACGGGGGGGGGGAPFVSSNPCDASPVLADTDPVSAAHALGVCDGLQTATWILPDGTPATPGPSFDSGHGILADFGTNNGAREGFALLALSTGSARRPVDPGFQANFDKGYTSGFPAGFPQDNPACPGVVTASPHDGIGLSVVLDVPAGVTGFAFDYFFLSHDHPSFECSTFSDVAAAIVLRPAQSPTNVLLDPAGHSMTASSVSMRACTSCPLGTAALTGTGFESGGGTDWMTTGTVPVTPGTTIEIRFVIWDSGDGQQDSTLLLDDFRWIAGP
jgi:hypothetical protein